MQYGVDMYEVNLIPIDRQIAKRRSALTRLWIGLCSGYVASLALIWMISAGSAYVGDDPQERIQAVSEQIEQSKVANITLTVQLTQARSVFEASRQIGERPDWSILMALISQTRGDQIVLKRLAVQQARSNGSMTDRLAVSDGYRVRIDGYGLTQGAVSSFALHLERTKVFSRVTVLTTSREPFMGKSAVGFEFECLLGEQGGQLR